MSNVIECFMIEETGRVYFQFGRFEQGPCPSLGEYHHATSYVDDVPDDESWRLQDDDPRVPSVCACGHTFGPHTSSASKGRWYRDPRDGSTWRHLGESPAGAMWFAPYLLDARWSLSPEYLRDHDGKRSPLVVKLPDGGSWCVDEQARWDGKLQGRGWTVTGAPPRLTASPSIQTLRYHGFLRDGRLESC